MMVSRPTRPTCSRASAVTGAGRVAGYGPSGPGRQVSTIARTNSAAWIARSRKPAVMAQDGQVPPVLGDLGARIGERPPQMGHQ